MDPGLSFEVPNFFPVRIQIANTRNEGEVISFLVVERDFAFVPPYENIFSFILINSAIPKLPLDEAKGIQG